ncbi:helix-turn-helix domain-containing protein [Sedimentimonas flavescens]|uniref:helix-turn-helix domain-containing protein n=1 Tax=Sedimentimonas flavescens TaxID=2851012 RepID=UPI001C4A51C1|nr:helix-turn-helix domain-containing protein [Sedimentimonas flavescens]MBW0159498.1 helix-turn-helix domain-containing protein [Sedimentimonas flavescens]
MSHAATNWAIQQRGLKPTTKIVLWHLCDRFNPDYGCFPSQDRLAQDCEISRATLNRHLDALEGLNLIRRIRRIDAQSGQQRPTRYVLGFEPGFAVATSGTNGDGADGSADCGEAGQMNPPFDGSAPEEPCPDLRHGIEAEFCNEDSGLEDDFCRSPCLSSGQGAVSQFEAGPCLKKRDSRVSDCDNNPVRKPLSKPVKEEEDAQAREDLCEEFFERLLDALGLDPAALPGWWQGWPARLHIQRWHDELGLTLTEILATAASSRQDHPEPPDGPKALDRAMQRAALRKGNHAVRKRRKPAKALVPATPPITDLPAFYAEIVNSDRYLPVSAISNTMRDAMLARGLVTAQRLRERGVR